MPDRYTIKTGLFPIYLPVFNIQKVILIFLFLFSISVLYGQQNEGDTDTLKSKIFEMGEVTIKPFIVRTHQVNVFESVTASAIKISPSQSIGELLRSLATVDIRQRGPFGVQADVGILGGSFDQTMVLLNGIPVTDPQTGHNNLSLPVDIDDVGRIDILTGVSASHFGSNALTGAINIITGSSGKGNFRSSVTLGANELGRLSAGYSDTSGRFSYMISSSVTSSGGYRKNTDFFDRKAFFRTEYRHRRGVSDLQSGFTLKDFGANGFYSLKYPDQFEALRTGFMSLRYESKTRLNFIPAIFIRTNKDRFELVRNDNSIPFNHHRSIVAGMSLNVNSLHLLGRSGIGISMRNENIMSNVLGDLLETERGIFTRGYSRLITDLNAEHDFNVGIITAKAGLLASYNNFTGSAGYYPAFLLTAKLSEKTELYGSAAKSLRFPTFTDMFYRSPVQSGNRSLKPENAVLFEAGIKYSDNKISGNASVFRREVANMIDWVKDPSADSIIWRSMNHSSIVFNGFRFTVSYIPGTSGGSSLFSLSYAFLDADREITMLSKYAFDYARHKLTSQVDAEIFWKIRVSAAMSFQDRNNYYQDITGKIVPYEPFGLCDMKIYREKGKYTIHLEASNLFNTLYYDYGGIPQPGTWITGGLALRL